MPGGHPARSCPWGRTPTTWLHCPSVPAGAGRARVGLDGGAEHLRSHPRPGPRAGSARLVAAAPGEPEHRPGVPPGVPVQGPDQPERAHRTPREVHPGRRTVVPVVGGPARLAYGAEVLEVGCGTGALWANVAPLLPDLRLTLTDLSEGMLAAAERAVSPLTNVAVAGVRTCDVQELPFPDRSFDVAVANHMLYHVPDPLLAAAELARVLRPGGVLLQLRTDPSPRGHRRPVAAGPRLRRSTSRTVASEIDRRGHPGPSSAFVRWYQHPSTWSAPTPATSSPSSRRAPPASRPTDQRRGLDDAVADRFTERRRAARQHGHRLLRGPRTGPRLAGSRSRDVRRPGPLAIRRCQSGSTSGASAPWALPVTMSSMRPGGTSMKMPSASAVSSPSLVDAAPGEDLASLLPVWRAARSSGASSGVGPAVPDLQRAGHRALADHDVGQPSSSSNSSAMTPPCTQVGGPS